MIDGKLYNFGYRSEQGVHYMLSFYLLEREYTRAVPVSTPSAEPCLVFSYRSYLEAWESTRTETGETITWIYDSSKLNGWFINILLRLYDQTLPDLHT
jgi:hypothetical protein